MTCSPVNAGAVPTASAAAPESAKVAPSPASSSSARPASSKTASGETGPVTVTVPEVAPETTPGGDGAGPAQPTKVAAPAGPELGASAVGAENSSNEATCSSGSSGEKPFPASATTTDDSSGETAISTGRTADSAEVRGSV